VALRSRRVSFGQGSHLAGLLWQRFRRGARDFFLPPKQEQPAPATSVAPAATETNGDTPSH
jgi:site-specific recombinase